MKKDNNFKNPFVVKLRSCPFSSNGNDRFAHNNALKVKYCKEIFIKFFQIHKYTISKI